MLLSRAGNVNVMIWGSYASTNKLLVELIHKLKWLLSTWSKLKQIKSSSSQHLPSTHAGSLFSGLTLQFLEEELGGFGVILKHLGQQEGKANKSEVAIWDHDGHVCLPYGPCQGKCITSAMQEAKAWMLIQCEGQA